MKISGFWVLFFVLGTALMFLSFSKNRTSSSISGMVFTHHSDGMTMMAISRKLKQENGYNPSTDKKHDVAKVNLEDYHPIDPVPSSKASIRPGPIEHGTPLNPFIPKPSPPDNPSNGGST